MVLEPAQKDVGADRAGAEHGQEIVGQRGDDDVLAEEVEGGVLDGRFPAVQGRPLFVQDHVGHDVAPGAGDQARVDGGQVGHADLAVDVRVLQRLVLVLDESLGLLAVSGAQAGPLAGLGVDAVKTAAAVAALDDSITLFHILLHSG